MPLEVTLDTEIEDLEREYPEVVGFLSKRGVRCVRCGEPVWGNLGQLLDEDGVVNPQALVDELNAFLSRK